MSAGAGTRSVSKAKVRRIQGRQLRREGASQREINRLVPILMAQIQQESGFRTNLGSEAGARDVAQFMPGTAPTYGVTLGDNRIRDDIRGQVKMMYPLIQKYGVGGALRAYNAGEGNMNAGFSETVNYQAAVEAGADRYKRPGGETVTGRAGPGKTIVVGDSLGEGTVPYLQGLIGGKLRSDTVVGRSSSDGIDALERLLQQGRKPRQIVLDLGTNDGSAAELRASIRRAKQLAPGIRIIVPTVNGPDAHAKNMMLRQMKGIRVVDWAKQSRRHPGFIGDDGIHATSEGYERRASKLARAIKGGVSATTSTAPGLDPLTITSGGGKDPMAVLELVKTLGREDTGPLDILTAVQAVNAEEPTTETTLPGMPALTLPTRATATPTGGGGGGGGPKSLKNAEGGIYEVFYDPLNVYWDSGGKREGQIGGHSDHVHVSADTPYVVAAGKLAQRMGLTVREQSSFDPVDAVHTDTSFHYKDKAIDVSGPANLMKRFAVLMMRQAGKHGRGK